MISNQNTINNNIDNNKLCTIHPNRDIVFFCLDCKLITCCIQCTSSKGEHHGHRTDILESTSNIISLMNNFILQIETDENNNKFFKWNNLKFYIDDDSLKFKENEGIALKYNYNILSKLKNLLPSTVMLLDGFNQKLTAGILPDSVQSLYLGDIKQELIIGSITSTNNKPDIVVFDYVAKLIRVIDVCVPYDRNIIKRQWEKIDKYSYFINYFKNQYKDENDKSFDVQIVPIITGAFGSIISSNTTHTINNVTHPIRTLKECVYQLPLSITERERLIKKVPRLAITGTSLLLNAWSQHHSISKTNNNN
ncbi:hypothetical protein ACTFIZ_011879 [Dictyostelium cf. discoideum]